MTDDIGSGLTQFMGNVRKERMELTKAPKIKIKKKKKEKTPSEKVKALIKKIETGKLKRKKILKPSPRVTVIIEKFKKQKAFGQPQRTSPLFYNVQ